MPPRGLHGPSKKKTAPKHGPGDVHRVTRPPIRDDDPSWPHLAQMLGEIVGELHRIGELLEKFANPPRRQTLDELDPLVPSQLRERVGREFVSGGFHKRSGDIYQSVAEPGTPNAEKFDADDPSGSVRPTGQRRD